MKSRFLLILIVLLAFVLRFFDLGNVPFGFHRDEANFGYNAYSLLLTGRDVTGNVLPVHIESFLHSPAGYSYLTIPVVALFGLTEFSTRFVSALFGSLTILLTYFLVIRLCAGSLSKKVTDKFDAESFALLSSLFLAISPWHINLSRVATENVIVVFFIVLAVLLHLYWIKQQKILLLLGSFFCFAITLTLYQAPRAFLPFFIPLLFVFFPPKQWKKQLILPSILFLVTIIVPTVMILSSHELNERIRMLSIFQHPETQLILAEQFREDGSLDVPLLVTRIFHNKVINYGTTFSQNYFAHFSYEFLFTDMGFPDRYRVPQMGLLYFFELPLLLIGLWQLFYRQRRLSLFLGGWILLAPLGSAMTFHDSPNLQRTLILFPALSMVSAYGLLIVWGYIRRIPFRRFVQALLLFSILFSFVYYLHQYYVHQLNHRPWFRQEGYKELIAYINEHPEYKQVVVTDEESDPSIFFLFFNRYDPARIQKEVSGQEIESYGRMNFAQYTFVKDPCPLHAESEKDPKTHLPLLSGREGVLYVNQGTCKIKDTRIKPLNIIKRADGTAAFTVVAIQ